MKWIFIQNKFSLSRYEGIKGYYKGIIPNLLKVTPATAITFVVYETVSNALLNRNKWMFSIICQNFSL